MRPELNRIQLIEKHIRQELSASELEKFNQLLENDPDFKQEIEIQQNLMKGFERLAIKGAIQKGYTKYLFKKGMGTYGIGGLAIALIVSLSLYFYEVPTETLAEDSGSNVRLEEQKLASPEDYIEAQNFDLSMYQDTAIETKGGIVFAIPQDAFVDENGNVVSGNIDFEVKEALSPLDIISAGLSTMADSNLLETAGMFFLNAKKQGKLIFMNPNSNILADLPTNNKKQDMLLFDGEKDALGNINWVNPVALENFLTPVDIFSLNFYPDGYERKLGELGYDISNKAFKDSLFYSFVCGGFESLQYNRSINNTISSRGELEAEATEQVSCGILPSQIKAIWSNEFQNTLIATKAFEERLQQIYKTCNEDILQMYITNLDLPLHQIDAKVADMLSGNERQIFLDFADRKDGKVNIRDKRLRTLSRYYQNKSRIYANAISSNNRKYWKTQQKLNKEFSNKTTEKRSKDARFSRENYQKGLNLNLNEAYLQMGLKRPLNFIPPKVNQVYRIRIVSLGWKNVDRYVRNSTLLRRTIVRRIDTTSVKIIYNTFFASINDNVYDRLNVYLISDQLPHFRKLTVKNNAITASINELLNYHLVSIAFKDDNKYFFEHKDVKVSDSLDIKLQLVNDISIKRALKKICGTDIERNIKNDIDFSIYQIANQKRLDENKQLKQLREKLYPIIFPCNESPDVKSATDAEIGKDIFEDTAVEIPEIRDSNILYSGAEGVEMVEGIGTVFQFAVIEDKPVFPEGMANLMKFIHANAKYPDIAKEKGIEGKVYVQFVINKQGEIINVFIARGIHPYLDNEALRVVKSMPDWKPGRNRGKAVNVSYIVPVNFKLY